MIKIPFYYDVVSPYSWLAFEVFCRFQKRWDIELEYRPILLGGVMQTTGNQPPASLPARAPYLLKDLYRQSQYFQIPIQIPPDFPSNSLSAMRLLTVIKGQAPEQLESVSRALWQSHYGEGLNILESLNRLNSTWLTETQNPEVKERLKNITSEAVKRGAFGAPTYFIPTQDGDEMFFGSDRFHLVAPLLGHPWDGPIL